MPLYCCYCGSLCVTTSTSCEFCHRRFVKQPPDSDSGEDDDELIEVGLDEVKIVDLASPPDHQDMIYGYIDRCRGEFVHTFHFCKEADGSFVLAASMSATGEGPIFFHTRTDLNGDHVRMSDVPKKLGHSGFVACLIPSSLLGTEFLLTTKEESTITQKLLAAISRKARSKELDMEALEPIDIEPSRDAQTNNNRGRELGVFVFDPNLLGTQPNTVKATVRANPKSDFAKVPIKQRIAKKSATRMASDQTLFERLRGKKDKSYRALVQNEEEEDEIATFETKKPQWNAVIGGWTLDFNGRVTVSSKKNFILVPSSIDELSFGADTIGVRFGKVSKHRFNLDYRFPYSPLASLAVATSMFTRKLIVAW